ncbi:MAG: hypothetical protein K2P78_08575 [Gemmataceae bacterium]|nr:hypothetical protein [Gemmataceae bacterium]
MPKKLGIGTYSENFQGGDYTDDEWEFIRAVADYQKRWRRRFPSYREVLFVARCLGYRKVAAAVPVDLTPTAAEAELLRATKPAG